MRAKLGGRRILVLTGVLILGVIAAAAYVNSGPASDGAVPMQEDSTIPIPSEVAPDQPTLIEGDDGPSFSTREWRTDFTRHSVPYEEIISGGVPKDGIPAIDEPKFVGFAAADRFVAALEPVIALELNSEARAYPLQILIWHEIVNDVVGGDPVVVTFCPLCNTAIVFERTLSGQVFDFGTTGKLRYSDPVMYDRQTESWWQQITGEAIVGQLTGTKLVLLPAQLISYERFKEDFPFGSVLSRETGFSRSYGSNPYWGYNNVNSSPFLFRGPTDGRLRPMERVATLAINDVAVAYPFEVLEEERVVNDEVGGEAIVVMFAPGTKSALDQSQIAASKDIGATGVFRRGFEGRLLTFRADGDFFIDNETGSRWSLTGKAVAGELEGAQLTPIVHANHFWFAWVPFWPDTLVYGS